ncbi:hypothetical protein RclHR1_18340002 [Rhizophagus clarus]|uniref:Ion transport domain-containing protein n=1 Tax=Rhizophagus clarus TaxID=94130 RepID=A0A2Z6R0P4_9GLOM|nr:hypothetical protein RclHR1_18340002 [Rhizophagus clarus]
MDEIIQIDNKYNDSKYDDNERNPSDAHKGKQISLVSLSPNGKCIVTYSEDDNSIERWIVKDPKLSPREKVNSLSPNNSKLCLQGKAYELSKEEIDKLSAEVSTNLLTDKIDFIKVNDYGTVCYSYNSILIIVSMDINKVQILELHHKPRWIYFNKDVRLVNDSRISVYSLNELNLTSSYKVSSYVRGVVIDNNNIWFINKDCLYQWELKSLQLKFIYSLKSKYHKYDAYAFRTVISKENLIVVKCWSFIEIFLVGVHFPIMNIEVTDTVNVVLLCEAQYNYLLVFDTPQKYIKQNIILYYINDIDKQPVDASKIFNDKLNDENPENNENKFILYEYNSESKEAFGLFNGKILCINLSDFNWHDFFVSNHKDSDENVGGWNTYLCQTFKNYCIDTLISPDMENIRSLIIKYTNKYNNDDAYTDYQTQHESKEIKFKNQEYEWEIDVENRKLLVYSDNKQMCSSDLSYFGHLNQQYGLLWKILDNNAIALLSYGHFLVIYEYDVNNNSISTPYSLSTDNHLEKLKDKDFSGTKLPNPITNTRNPILDSENINKLFIIESTINYDLSLAKYGRTLLESLLKLTEPELTRSIELLYNKCTTLVKEDPKRNLKFLSIITSSMNGLYKKYPDYITKFNSEMFMFLDPKDETILYSDNCSSHLDTFTNEVDVKYNSWWSEIFWPKSSIFIDTCKKEFYTNWNGEAVINFKWKKFGRKYYFPIWLIFTVFLVCFTLASYPTSSITQENRVKLYQTSIAFGFFHIIFELRQFIWNPKKYILSIWNFFDLSAYFPATIASIYWIKYSSIPEWALSLSCLLLDLKFLLFFRVFESFGVYFAIIFGVARRIFYFLFVLALIIASFAHALFLLLHPQNLIDSFKTPNLSDPNNPWALSNTYNQTDENGNVLNETLIQVPTESTNLFYSYPSSLLATYLFLTGNQNSISPWTPTSTAENAILYILLVVFTFLVVIYLMNLFIGLLNMAIGENNDRASYLVQKAEVIAEIELFYLLPHQRRWRSWFPEVIYYHAEIEKAQVYIKEAINKGEWKMEDWPEMKYKILKLLRIEDIIKN